MGLRGPQGSLSDANICKLDFLSLCFDREGNDRSSRGIEGEVWEEQEMINYK